MNNILTVDLSVGNVIVTKESLWQYDYGQVIVFTGVELPETFEVHFGNDQDIGHAKMVLGANNEVLIPDEYLTKGARLYAWIFLHTGEDDGETEYRITVPVKKRPAPDPSEPTPVERDIIDQAIAALNNGVTRSESASDDAQQSASSASESASTATNAASDASGYASSASESATSAERDADLSEGYASSASASASAAALSESNARSSAESASADEQSARASKNLAQEYRYDAQSFSRSAETSARQSGQSATLSNTQALKSEGFAVGQQNGVDVGSDSLYYHNNAKYYAE